MPISSARENTHEGNSAICAGYNDGIACVVNLVGTTENKGYNTAFGAVIHVTKRALESIDPAKGALQGKAFDLRGGDGHGKGFETRRLNAVE